MAEVLTAHDVDDWRKDTFVATLAHELRQPLSVLVLQVEMVRVAPGTEALRRAADVMARQLSQMSRLVEDLVDAKRLESGKVSLQKGRLDLREVMQDGAASVEYSVAERRQNLIVDNVREPLWVDGDRQRLLQVILNLLRNAVKFTPPGGRITMAAERGASHIVLRVSDTGCGIERESLPYVFDMFSQVHPQEGNGLGLGLSIVREIVLLHSGRIEVLSEGTSKGSQFVVHLPVSEGGN